MPTSPVENAAATLYNHWDLFTVSSGSHGTDSTAGVSEKMNMTTFVKTIDPPTLLQENEPSGPSTNSQLATVCTRPAIIEDSNDAESLPPLGYFQEIVKQRFPELVATLLVNSDGTGLLQITHTTVYNHPPAGYVHRVRIILLPAVHGYHYDLQALLVSVKTGVILSEQCFIKVYKSLLQSHRFVYCPGIDYQEYHDNYYSVIPFHIKKVNLSTTPFQRVDAKGCLLGTSFQRMQLVKTKPLVKFCAHSASIFGEILNIKRKNQP